MKTKRKSFRKSNAQDVFGVFKARRDEVSIGSLWQTFFAGGAFVLTVAASSLYLLGHLYLERLFSPFSLSSLVVGLDFHELVYVGWFAFVLWFGGVLEGKAQALLPAIMLTVFFVVVALGVYLANYPNAQKPFRENAKNPHLERIIRLDQKAKGLLSGGVISLFLAAGVWPVVLAVVLLLSQLVLIGRYSADSVLLGRAKLANKDISGRLVPVSGGRADTLFVLDGSEKITGFLLFSTRNSYAIVDSKTGKGRVINPQIVRYAEPIPE